MEQLMYVSDILKKVMPLGVEADTDIFFPFGTL